MDDFEKQVLNGIGEIKTQQKTAEQKTAELVANLDQLDQSTKTAFEELTKVKNDLGTLSERMDAIKKVRTQLARESRAAFGSPLDVARRNPETVARLNLMLREALNPVANGRYTKAIDDLQKQLGIDAEQRALGTGATPGSSWLDSGVLPEIYDVLSSYGIWSSFQVMPVGNLTTGVPVRTARAIAYYLADGVQIAVDANSAGSTTSMTAGKIAVLMAASRELLEDAAYDASGIILDELMEAIAYRLDWTCLQADGTATGTAAKLDGGFTGIFGGGGTAAGAATGNVSIATLDYADVLKCLTVVAADVLRRPCRWWIHPTILAKMMGILDSNGRPIFQTAIEAPTFGGMGSILGYPVTMADAAPSADTTSSKVAAFGDPRGGVVGLRKSIEIVGSEHHLFDYNQIAFRGIARAFFKVRAATAFGILTNAAS